MFSNKSSIWVSKWSLHIHVRIDDVTSDDVMVQGMMTSYGVFAQLYTAYKPWFYQNVLRLLRKGKFSNFLSEKMVSRETIFSEKRGLSFGHG